MIERWFEAFTLLEKETVPDGLGGTGTTYVPILGFRGALTTTTAEQTVMAEQPILAETLVLLHEFDITLSSGECVRREKDGAMYRVADRSGNMRAPAFSGLRFAQVPVERLVIPC